MSSSELIVSFLLRWNSKFGKSNTSSFSRYPSSFEHLVPVVLWVLLYVAAQDFEQKLFSETFFTPVSNLQWAGRVWLIVLVLKTNGRRKSLRGFKSHAHYHLFYAKKFTVRLCWKSVKLLSESSSRVQFLLLAHFYNASQKTSPACRGGSSSPFSLIGKAVFL